MCPVNPRLPLTVREVPPKEELPDRPNDELLEPNREPLEALEPKREPEVEELPKCEPSIFETPRLGEIELRVADEPNIELRPDVDEPLLKLPAREFDATEGEFDPRDAPAADELPANERAFDPPAAGELPEFTPACVPAVFPVLGPRALPVLPENECQLPSAFARVAPRPAGQPDERAFNEFERPALEPAPPLRAFIDELPPARPPFIPFERAPPYAPFEREPPYMLPPRPYEPMLRAELPGDPPPRYMPPPPPRYAPPPPP